MAEGWTSFTALTRIGPELLHERISRDPAAAARWVEAAALAGIVNAQIAWGQMLVDGHGVARDPEAGLRWFAIAAAAGSLEGINMVGRCHELGWGVPADAARAAAHYREAARAGHGWAQFNLATLLLDGREGAAGLGEAPYREALHWYVRAARRRHGDAAAKAATMVGRFLEQGWERAARPPAALRWYRRGASGGDYRGQFDYARLLLERTGRLDHAAPWFARSIETGVPAFCRQVGAALRQAPQAALHPLARRALERAAESGSAADLRALGGALAEGLGGLPDTDGAARAFGRARRVEEQIGRGAASGASLSPEAAPRARAFLGASRKAALRAVRRAFGRLKARRRPITSKL